MAVWAADIFPYIQTITWFGIYTYMYKPNILSKYIQATILGMCFAHILNQSIALADDTIVARLTGATPDVLPAILAIVVGIGYIALLIPGARRIYRVAATISIAQTLGLAIPYGLAELWGSVIAYGKGAFTSLNGLVAAFVFITVICYYFFSKVLDRPTGILRSIGRVWLFTYMAFAAVQIIIQMLNAVSYNLILVRPGSAWNTWWILAIMLIVILIDTQVDLGKLIRGKAKEVTAS